jgi:F-type H+-transporting ATPase subunit epsilon
MAEEQGKIELEIVTPAKLLFSESAYMVVVPGNEGVFGVMPGHAPMLSQVRAGTIDVYDGDKVSTQIFVEGGIAEVTAGRCTVLAEEALMVVDIDKSAAEERLQQARAAQDDDKDHVDGLDTPEVVAAEAQVAAADG